MTNVLQKRYKSEFGMNTNSQKMDCSPPFIAYTEPNLTRNVESLILEEAQKLKSDKLERSDEVEYTLTVVVSDMKIRKKEDNVKSS